MKKCLIQSEYQKAHYFINTILTTFRHFINFQASNLHYNSDSDL